MALHQTAIAKRQKSPVLSLVAGSVVKEVITYTLPGAWTAASDELEITAIPAYAQVLSVQVLSTGLAASTIDVGLMSGTFGDNVDGRTVGDEFIDGGDAVAGVTSAVVDCLAVAPSATAIRPIGAVLSANQTVGDTLTFIIEYMASDPNA